jgi:hypothetical protein
MVLLAGEWVGAWLEMSLTFLVAAIGVAGLGWWVLRGDARNRRAEASSDSPPETEHSEPHP